MVQQLYRSVIGETSSVNSNNYYSIRVFVRCVSSLKDSTSPHTVNLNDKIYTTCCHFIFHWDINL